MKDYDYDYIIKFCDVNSDIEEKTSTTVKLYHTNKEGLSVKKEFTLDKKYVPLLTLTAAMEREDFTGFVCSLQKKNDSETSEGSLLFYNGNLAYADVTIKIEDKPVVKNETFGPIFLPLLSLVNINSSSLCLDLVDKLNKLKDSIFIARLHSNQERMFLIQKIIKDKVNIYYVQDDELKVYQNVEYTTTIENNYNVYINVEVEDLNKEPIQLLYVDNLSAHQD